MTLATTLARSYRPARKVRLQHPAGSPQRLLELTHTRLLLLQFALQPLDLAVVGWFAIAADSSGSGGG